MDEEVLKRKKKILGFNEVRKYWEEEEEEVKKKEI